MWYSTGTLLSLLLVILTAGLSGCKREFSSDKVVGDQSCALSLAPRWWPSSRGRPATQAFTAYRTIDGQEFDVTSQVAWSSGRPALATVDASGVATTGPDFGGEVEVRAAIAGLTATAQLRVRYVLSEVVPDAANPVGTNPEARFNGQDDAARAPTLAYPNTGVLLPPNLHRIEDSFAPGSAQNSVFEIAFANDLTDVRLYARCSALPPPDVGCVVEPEGRAWTGLAETNRGAQDVTLTVRGTDDGGSAVGRSAAHTLKFANEDVRGALYYWTPSAGPRSCVGTSATRRPKPRRHSSAPMRRARGVASAATP